MVAVVLLAPPALFFELDHCVYVCLRVSDNEGFEIGIAKVLLYNEYLTSKVFFFRFAWEMDADRG